MEEETYSVPLRIMIKCKNKYHATPNGFFFFFNTEIVHRTTAVDILNSGSSCHCSRRKCKQQCTLYTIRVL